MRLAHKSMDVWKEAMKLVELTFQITSVFPREERFGLAAHCRKTAVSVASNIAEGAARTSSKDRCRFYEISRSSLSELDTQIDIAVRTKLMKQEDYERFQSKLYRTFTMLSKLIKATR